MKYEDFPKFLEGFNQIRSFKGRMDFANEHLQRIGSGSGRVVYDIDGEKVFKLAKNAKGIAQNEAEAGVGYYADTLHVVTEIFDSADDNSWLVSEQAKMVNEKRIKELTGIPSLNDLYYFLRNTVDQNKGGRKMFGQDKEVEEFFWENEFASDLITFVVNYGQTPGDMGRPSTYGEVLRDGQPTIVLTDYGLNDEVFNTHYSPQRKQRHQMYELYGFQDGNDDILSDIGNVGANERHGMWGLMPYSVSDGPGVINERFVDFVSKKRKYPKKPVSSLPFLSDCFHECVNNLKETLNSVDNKKQFFNNLLELQQYLIEQGYYDRDPLMKEEYVINEDAPIPPVDYDTLDDKSYAIELAQGVAAKLDLGGVGYLGYGGNGVAFEVNNRVVLKLTTDLGEADAAFIVLRNGAKYLADIYNIYKVVDTEKNKSVFAILQENIINKPLDKFIKMEADINKIFPEYSYQDFLSGIRKKDRFDYNKSIEFAKTLLTENPEANVSQADRKAAHDLIVGITNIRQELIDLGIKSTDYISNSNLGYSNGALKFFDVGGHFEPEPNVGKNVITLPENVTEGQINEDYPRERADAVAIQIGKKLGVEPHYLGHGLFGVAYDIGDNKVLKITSDNSEAAENLELIGKPLKYIAQPYKVYKVESKTNPDFPKTYAIILEKLKTDAAYFKRMYDRLEYAFKTFFDIDYKEALEAYLYGYQFDHDVNKDDVDRYFKKNSEDAEFFFSILRIAEELEKYGVESVIEYYNPYNLGYKKSGAIGLFDVGFGNGFLQPTDAEKIDVNVDEDGSSKFSTDSDLGQDGFPAYNNGEDSSPMNQNNLDANSAMYGGDGLDEDLEYNHVVGDATDDEFEMTEDRKKAWVPGSQAVTVKKRCRLGGKADGTSDACNQGDINNLEFSALTEEDIEEGVGDKYAEKFGVKPEFDNFEDEYRKKKSSEENVVIYNDPKIDWQIIENPQTLDNIGKNVRGVIDKAGNFFVEQRSHHIHKIIIDVLNSRRLLHKDYMSSLDDTLPTDYVTVTRLDDTNKILLGESNQAMYPDELRPDWGFEGYPTHAEAAPVYQKFMDAAQRRNPRIDFVNEFLPTYGKTKKTDYSKLMIEGDIMQLGDLPFKSEIESLGGKIYSVGGAVRDEFLGKESKDLDILITGIPMDELEQLLSKYGKVNTVGASFGVIKFVPKGSTEEIDIAIPRTERATGGGGHKDFDVTSDHELPIEKDLERRDFTINAIGKDSEGNIVDPYGGQEDLKNKIIRIVNPVAFSDDPLRMLRAVQFASRFGFVIEPTTMEMIKTNAQKIKEIPAERILIELDKIVKKGNKRIGAQLLQNTGLFKQIFGYDLKTSTIDRSDFEGVKTMGEYLFLLTRLLRDPVGFVKNNLKGDLVTEKQIKALQHAYDAANEFDVMKTRTAAHNVYVTSKDMLQSEILPEAITVAAQELLGGKYPKTLGELAVNGNDLMGLGLQGKQIGDALKQMLVKVYDDKIRNNKEELLSLVQQSPTDIKEGWDNYENPVWDVNGEMVDVEFFMKEYDVWNTQGGTLGYPDPSKESVLEFLQNNYEDFSTDERLKKELYWTLTDRDLLKEDNVKRVSYSAVVLDDMSRAKLLKVFTPMIPEGWEVIAHHMTIKMGPLDIGTKEKEDMSGNTEIILNVVDYGMDDKVMAVGVEGYHSTNAKAHITLAVNRADGGKPFMSNKLTEWKPLGFPLELTGKVSEE